MCALVSIGAVRALALVALVGLSLCHHSVAWGPVLSRVDGVQRNRQQPTNKASRRSCFGRTNAKQLSTSSSPPLEAASSDQEQEKPTQSEAAVPKGDGVVEQVTGAPPSVQQQPPEKPQQPWWEDERRTQGLPTLTASTQWRMFLTLKASNERENKERTIRMGGEGVCSCTTAYVRLFSQPAKD